jgi:hypothetical protein
MVHDTIYIVPSQIWHYCPDNTPQWSRIHIAACRPENMQASVGYNATYACRPSIGESDNVRLYVAWEQFDSTNVESTTSRLRAGVWVSGSANNGMTWAPGLLVTERNTFSHRFPCIIDRMVGSPSDDTICVLYLMDQIAGFFVQGEGPATPNPVICQFMPSPLVGVKESSNPQAPSLKPMVTIVRGALLLEGDCPRTGTVPKAYLLDASGRRVLGLHPGANDVRTLAPGVYFMRAASREPSAVSCSKVLAMR